MKKINIAIDGYSGCGKSTLAKALAKELNYIYIDTGAMYRAITYYFQKHEIPLDDKDAINNALTNIKISFDNCSGLNTTILNGENIESKIRSLQVSSYVSEVAAIPAVRHFLKDKQQEMGKNKGVVMDGRDIGTVIFPDAELKLFITALPKIRAARRIEELKQRGQNVAPEEVLQNLLKRDHIDSTRAVSPLKKADDAIEIDNSYLTKEQQLKKALTFVSEIIDN